MKSYRVTSDAELSNHAALLVGEARECASFLILLPNRLPIVAKDFEKYFIDEYSFVQVVFAVSADGFVSTLDEMRCALGVEGFNG